MLTDKHTNAAGAISTGFYDEWPPSIPRPSATDSYTATYDGIEFVTLCGHDETIAVYMTIAVYGVDGYAFKRLDAWPREIETR